MKIVLLCGSTVFLVFRLLYGGAMGSLKMGGALLCFVYFQAAFRGWMFLNLAMVEILICA